MSERLQIKRHEEIFPSRREAMHYIDDMFRTTALVGEPAMFLYGDERNPHAILALSTIGDGTLSPKGRVFCIDTARIVEDIHAIEEELSKDTELIGSLTDLVNKVIASTGLEADGSYKADIDDELLRKSTSINECVKILSAYIQKHARNNTIIVKNTDTVAFNKVESEDGIELSADVRISKYGNLDPDFNDNIIIKTDDGIYAAADLDWDSVNGILTFTASKTKDDGTVGVRVIEKKFNIGTHTHIESIVYDPETEKIIFTFADASGNKYSESVSAAGIITEWEVDNKVGSAIRLEKTRVKEGKDKLSADVIISDDEDNILEKSSVTGALSVKGTADNIKYAKETVESALDALKKADEDNLKESKDYTDEKFKEVNDKVEIINGDNETEGSIKKALVDAKAYADEEIEKMAETKADKDSVYTIEQTDELLDGKVSEVKVVVNPDNELVYYLMVDGETAGTINIPSDQFLKEVYYDKGNKEIVFQFNTEQGIEEVRVSVSDLVDIYTAGNGLQMNGGEISVKVNPASENYIKVDANGILISGIDKAISDSVSVESKRAKNAEKANADAIKVNADAIAIINGNESQAGSIKKALADAKAYTDDEIAKVVESIENEVERAESAEKELKSSIEANETAIADNKAAIEANAKAIDDNKTAIAENKDAIVIINGNEAQAGSIKKALADAKAYTDEQVTAEADRAKAAEEANATAIETNKTAIEANAKDIADNKTAIEANAKAIEENANAIAENVAKIDVINGNESTEGSIKKALADAKAYADTKVASVELKKVDDLEYEIFVDGKSIGKINIPQDQFLTNVTYDANNTSLIFEFSVQGEPQKIVVNIGDLVDTYTAGNGLSLDNNQFAIKIDSASENYLTVSGEGIKLSGIGNALSLKAEASDLAAEITRAKDAEKANADAIAIINGNDAQEGSIAYAVKVEADRAKAAEKVNADAIADNAEAIEANKAAIEANAKDIADNKTAIAENKDAIVIINGNEAQAGSIKKALADAKAYADEQVTAEANRATAAESKVLADSKTYTDTQVATKVGEVELVKTGELSYSLMVDGETKGSFTIPEDQFLKSVEYDAANDKLIFIFSTSEGDNKVEISMKDLVDTYTAGNGLLLENNQFAIKVSPATQDYISVDINGVAIKGIDEALLLKANVSDVYSKEEADDKFLTEHQDISTLASKEEVKAVSDALTAEVTRATAAESDLGEDVQENMDAITLLNANALTEGSVDYKVAAEKTRAEAAEAIMNTSIASNATAIANEAKRATDAESTLSAAIQANADAITNEATIARAAEKANADAIAANKEAIDLLNENSLVEGSVDYKVANEAARATAVEATLSEAIATEKSRAEAAEAQALTDAKKYTDEQVATKVGKVEVDKVTDLQYSVLVDGVSVGTIDIPKDQFLKSAKYDAGNKQLVLVFSTSEGEKIEYISVADLVDTYTAGNGLSLADNQFAVKVDSASEEYLTVSEEGIKLSGINGKLAEKANADDVYTKTEADNKFLVDADIANFATDEELKTVSDGLAAEISRAKAAEEANANAIEVNSDAIAIINNPEAVTGSLTKTLADAKAYALSQVEAEATIARAAEKANADAIATKANAADVYTKTEADGKFLTEHQDISSLASKEEVKVVSDALAAEVTRATAAEKANADAIAKINANEATEGSIAYAVKVEADRAKAAEGNLQNAIDKINNVEAVEGSMTKVLADAKAYADAKVTAEANRATAAEEANATAITTEKTRAEAAEAKALADAKVYTDTKVAEKVSDVKVEKVNDLQYKVVVDGESVGTIDIPKDQFLKSASYDSGNKQLVLVFSTSEGDKTESISVADLVDTYTAGNGLTLTDNAFAVKVDSGSEAYLSVSENGVKLSGINDKLAEKADKSEIPSLEGYATQSWVESKNYLTQHQDLSHLATNASLNTEIERAKAAEEALKTAIADEKLRAQTAENDIKVLINNNTSTLDLLLAPVGTEGSVANEIKEVEDKIKLLLETETGKRETADEYLQKQINDLLKLEGELKEYANEKVESETTRAMNAESLLQSNITNEANRAIAAESTLQSAINTVKSELSAETNRATAAEARMLEEAKDYADDLLTDFEKDIEDASDSALEEAKKYADNLLTGFTQQITQAEANAKAYADATENHVTTVQFSADFKTLSFGFKNGSSVNVDMTGFMNAVVDMVTYTVGATETTGGIITDDNEIQINVTNLDSGTYENVVEEEEPTTGSTEEPTTGTTEEGTV